ncbi:MAG: prepilin-type N-terminal cleavage/methylation domain-containing protein [Synechococcales bacterium]|nr:prepilin-type N-terminal cleavage/methylation domain-containing protein [Synechococcales bacterium]
MTHFTRALRRLSHGNPPQANAPEQGLTLMECIVAIAVIAVTGAVIAPPLLLATATRLQNQRAEQALQIAQGEVDRIQTLVNRGAHKAGILPAVAGLAANESLSDQDAPGSSSGILKSINPTATCSGTAYTGQQIAANKALEVDLNGDCRTDFIVQAFRWGDEYSAAETAIPTAADRRPSEFELMVRVYAASAAGNFGNLGTAPASLQFTSGEGNQRERPLAVLSTRITWSDRDDSLLCYHSSSNCTPTPPAPPPTPPTP